MKLITKEIEDMIAKHPIHSHDGEGENALVIVKFFYPWGAGTWLATEGEKQEDGDYLFFGYCEIGYEWEAGYFSLNELKKITKFGRPAVEREKFDGGRKKTVKILMR